MSALQPLILVTLRLEKVPASLGTDIYKWSTRPLSANTLWAEGRVIEVGKIERNISSIDGDYDVASVTVRLSDHDGLFRGLLADPTTRYITSREGSIELLSEAGLAAGTAWRTLFRGRVSDIQANVDLTVSITLADEVGSHMSGFDLEKPMGVRITRREHPNADDKVINRIYPIVIGEHSDYGAVDENGAVADKGLLPVVDVGDYVILEDGTLVEDGGTPEYLTAPTSFAAVVNGTPATTERTYQVSAISPWGETTVSSVTVTNSAASLTVTDSITLTWDAQLAAVEYRVYRSGRLLKRLNNALTYTTPETTYTDDGTDSVSGVKPPATNSAQIDQVIGGQSGLDWGRCIVKIGAAAEIQHVYGSNLAEGEAPKRIRLPESVYGSEILIYGRSGWPHANPYIEINGIRMGVMYARGPRLEQHRAGTVTFAWNGCGDEDEGDGTGTTITEAFLAEQHVINEYMLKDGGVGYRTGTYGPLETYSNGVSKLKTSRFQAMQDLTETWIGGRGYQIAVAITEPISPREFLRWFHVTFASHTTSDHHGQIYPVLVDDTATVTAGRLYADRYNIIRATNQDIDHQATLSEVVYHFDFDTDGNKYRVRDLVLTADEATTAYFASRERRPRECRCTRDAATAKDAQSRHLTRYKVAPRYFEFETDYTGFEDEGGAAIRTTHYAGAGGVTGDSATPMLVVKHGIQLKAGRVTLTGLDMNRILTTGIPLLGDKTSIAGNLYDKTSPLPPPSGAYELR